MSIKKIKVEIFYKDNNVDLEFDTSEEALNCVGDYLNAKEIPLAIWVIKNKKVLLHYDIDCLKEFNNVNIE